MTYLTTQTYRNRFTITNSSGVPVNADSLPSLTMYANGVSVSDTVIVTAAATGVYDVAAPLSNRTAGEVIQIFGSPQVGGVAKPVSLTFTVSADLATSFDATVVSATDNSVTLTLPSGKRKSDLDLGFTIAFNGETSRITRTVPSGGNFVVSHSEAFTTNPVASNTVTIGDA